MSEDTLVQADLAQKASETAAQVGTLAIFDASVDLGQGASPQDELKEEDLQFMAVVGARLRKARKACGFTESTAGLALAHKGVTQISLFENGKRFPGVPNLLALAELYGVTVDYLLNRNDDILVSAEEGNQAVLRGVLVTALSTDFNSFVNAMAQRNALMIEGLSQDRVVLRQAATLSTELVDALEVVKRHAPEFEDVRGGAKLCRLIGELRGSMGECVKRLAQEKAFADYDGPVVPAPELVRARVQQMMLEL